MDYQAQTTADRSAAARIALRQAHRRAWGRLRPVPRLMGDAWATRYRVMTAEETAIKGRFDWSISPALRQIAEVCTHKGTRKAAVQKSAQVGYTAGVVCNVIGYHVHHRPSVVVVAFPRTQAAKDFASEKLDPMIMGTPVLRRRITLKSRAEGNSQLRKRFAGGLLKLVGTNSPSDVKSTSARVVIVEEPDDAATNVGGQGNSIKLLEERAKTYADHLILIGGTPTAKGASAVEAEMAKSDKRYFWVPCHECGETHVPSWDQVTIPEDTTATWRDVYGHHQHEKAFYSCPHCGSVWSDDDRIANLRRAERAGGGWVPTARSDMPGWYLNELLSTFDGSRVPVLARKYLEAKAKMDAGDNEDMIAFWNSTLGQSWEYRGELPEEDTLRERAEPYAEWTCPAGGLVAVMAVDVQHDRLAVSVWVFGRGEEMWLAYWGEHYGSTIVPGAGAWLELQQLITRKVRHACGAALPITVVGIDTGDGQTSDAAYTFIRAFDGKPVPVVAQKGASDNVGRVEIWTPPKSIDPNQRATKAARFGVKVHTIGTAKAKDLILGWSESAGRVRLTGNGPGRMHWYQGVRDDFFVQLLSEIKIPGRINKNRREWKKRTDRHNEALDNCVSAVHLYRHLRLHLRKPWQWDASELALRQAPLLPEPGDQVGEEAPAQAAAPAAAPAAPVTATPAPQIVVPTPVVMPYAPPPVPQPLAVNWIDG